MKMTDNKIIPQQSQGQSQKDTNAAFDADDQPNDKSNGLIDSKMSESVPLVKDVSENNRVEATKDQAGQNKRQAKKKPP